MHYHINMNIELKIFNDCKALEKDDKSKARTKNIVNTNKEVFGLYTKEINEIVKRYQYEDFKNLSNRNLYELNLIYIKINLKQMKNLAEQLDFLKNNIDIIDSWAITDTTYQLLRIKDFDTALTFFNDFS